MDAIVRTFTKCGTLCELRVLFPRVILCVSFVLVGGVGLEFRVLKVLTGRLKVNVNGVIEFLDDLLNDLFCLLLTPPRLLRGWLLRRYLLRGGLLGRLLSSLLLRGGLLGCLCGVSCLLGRLLSSRLLHGGLLGGVGGVGRLLRGRLLRGSLLRGDLLRRGLLRGRLLLLGGSTRRVDRGGSLLGARGLLRGGLHLRGFLSRRGVLCRSARCTHTGPFH